MHARWVVLIVLLSVHFVQGYRYAHVWTSNLSLWRRAVEVSPYKVRPHVNYSRYLIEAGQLEEALTEAQYADRLLTSSSTVSEHERRLFARILRDNLLILSLKQEMAQAGIR